jgi:hypothetical protein
MTYGSAIVPQTGHWLLTAGPFCHAISVINDVDIGLDSTIPVSPSSWARAIPRPENSVSQNFFRVIVMRAFHLQLATPDACCEKATPFDETSGRPSKYSATVHDGTPAAARVPLLHIRHDAFAGCGELGGNSV